MVVLENAFNLFFIILPFFKIEPLSVYYKMPESANFVIHARGNRVILRFEMYF